MLAFTVFLASLDSEEERDKLTLIYEKYYPNMLRTARRYTRNSGAEGDIVHDSVLKIIRNLEKIDLHNENSASCFIMTIVRNTAKDWLKYEAIRMSADVDEQEFRLSDENAVPLNSVLEKEGYNRLIGYISELNDTYRDACNLKFVCGLKDKEIAEVLGITEKNVSVRITRGRHKLIARIKEEHHE